MKALFNTTFSEIYTAVEKAGLTKTKYQNQDKPEGGDVMINPLRFHMGDEVYAIQVIGNNVVISCLIAELVKANNFSFMSAQY